MAGYGGGLTREQFLFYEIRIVSKLKFDGLSDEEIIEKVYNENLFQFPTSGMIKNITNVCLKRLNALDNDNLIRLIAEGSLDTAKFTNLYAIMKENILVYDFFTNVIGEKYRSMDYSFGDGDLNVFFMDLGLENDVVASWSDSTINKMKQVLKKFLLECGYIDSTKSETLNPILIDFELEEAIRETGDFRALSAFNVFNL